MGEYTEKGPENLFGDALSPEQRAGLCKFLKIPADSNDEQIVWAFRAHWKEHVSGVPEKHWGIDPIPEEDRKRLAGEPLLEREDIIKTIIENWGGDNEVPGSKE